ncbi:hypothetical protein WA026_017140 [Henosepilachna vigintioctopunctata]|uniref:Uncharacterized protein n=1 Tax=Henosepilachna vigintioctopunctata TaxID=420089 RepID=A0AAW1TUQ8_9CUCU
MEKTRDSLKEFSNFLDKKPFFGITSLGVNKPIQAMMREDYQEPKEKVDIRNLMKMKNFHKSFAESMSVLDESHGYADGYNYSSYDRMRLQKRRGTHKIVGPKDMYRYPGVSSMEFGWWLDHPDMDYSWVGEKRHSKPTSERTKYVDHMRKVYKFFNL